MTARRWRSRAAGSIATLLLALGALLGVAPAAQADDAATDTDNNIAEAIATDDGSSVFRLAFSVRKAGGDTVDPGNLALAYASCADCKALAVAVQIVFVKSDPSTFAPENAAVAVNESCTSCATAALAYQVVLQVPHGFKLPRSAEAELASLSAQMAQLGAQFEAGTLAFDDAVAQIDALADRVTEIVVQEVAAANERAARERARDGEGDHSDEATTTTTTTEPTSTSSTTIEETTTTTDGTTSTTAP